MINITTNDNELKTDLMWSNLSLSTKNEDFILNNISGNIKSGELIALIGPSGSGKTMLMNTLAGRTSNDLTISGKILLNNWDRSEVSWSDLVSYVCQNFYAYEYQTVKETLEFAYTVKIKKYLESSDRERIQELINFLGLSNSENTFVKQLSGGEKVRLSVGVELIGNPSILFLDEPTSGLDSTNALKIIELSRVLTNKGKSVIASIHQPSSKMLSYFDSIFLLAHGKTAFFGSVDNCIQFFQQNGYSLPVNTNPADFFLETLTIDSTTDETKKEGIERSDNLCKCWNESQSIHSSLFTNKILNPPGIQLQEGGSSLVIDFLSLVKRDLINKGRDLAFLFSQLFQKCLFGFLLSVSWWRFAAKDPISANDFRGISTFFIINSFFGISSPVLNSFAPDKLVIKRERQSGFYHGYICFISRLIAEYTYILAFEIPYLIIVYFSIGLWRNLLCFGYFVVIILLVDLFAITYGLCLGAITPNAKTAQILGVSFSVIFLLYSGAFNNPKNITVYLRWLVYVSPIQYAFRAFTQTQSEDRRFYFTSDDQNDKNLSLSSESYVESLGLDGLNFTICISILSLFTLTLLIIGSIFLHKFTQNKLTI